MSWRGQSPEGADVALTGEGGLTFEGADLGDFALVGEPACLVAFCFGVAALLAETGVLAEIAVGAVSALSVGLLGAGELVGALVGVAVAAMTIAGWRSALAGAPEFIARIPRVQVPTPRVPETAQAIADLDTGMVLPSTRSG